MRNSSSYGSLSVYVIDHNNIPYYSNSGTDLYLCKCGGASFRNEIYHLNRNYSHGYFVSAERRYRAIYDHTVFPRCNGSIRVLDIFRDPVAHVLSQYSHCKSAKVLKRKWDAIPPLTIWLKSFQHHQLTGPNHGLGGNPLSVRCYNPINLQSSYLTAPNRPKDLWFVGLVEYFAATKCLFVYQVNRTLQAGCDCSSGSRGDHLHVTHKIHSIGHHITTDNITAEDYKIIAEITYLDQLLYDEAKVVFLHRIEKAEWELRKLLLCREEMQALRSDVRRIRSEVKLKKRPEIWHEAPRVGVSNFTAHRHNNSATAVLSRDRNETDISK